MGRLAYRNAERKNPRPHKPINKAAGIEPVIGPTYRFAPGSGPQRDLITELGARSEERV